MEAEIKARRMAKLGEMKSRKVEGEGSEERFFLVNLTGAKILFYTVQCEHLEHWSRTRRKAVEMMHNIEGWGGEGV